VDCSVVVSQTFLLAGTFWLRNLTTDPRILPDVHTVCSDDRYLKLKIYVSKLILDSYESVPAKYVTLCCMI